MALQSGHMNQVHLYSSQSSDCPTSKVHQSDGNTKYSPRFQVNNKIHYEFTSLCYQLLIIQSLLLGFAD
ncbi:CLUMA_CG005222, isoform A [Clunio marinus]|uniref:CLUMA_CG005222, isoform A n=1 Tax=Clunio marinus TaxID=568069 RepID=A0A1J1HU19_9DIPT|nr:CLUMA_CG005222, isoform A [Clunio marinus]